MTSRGITGWNYKQRNYRIQVQWEKLHVTITNSEKVEKLQVNYKESNYMLQLKKEKLQVNYREWNGCRWKAPRTLAPRWKVPGLKPKLTQLFTGGLFSGAFSPATKEITRLTQQRNDSLQGIVPGVHFSQLFSLSEIEAQIFDERAMLRNLIIEVHPFRCCLVY